MGTVADYYKNITLTLVASSEPSVAILWKTGGIGVSDDRTRVRHDPDADRSLISLNAFAVIDVAVPCSC